MNNKSDKYILGMVAVVAIVAIIMMITTSVNNNNFGYAIKGIIDEANSNTVSADIRETALIESPQIGTINSTLTNNTFCRDSDTGWNYDIKGTVSGKLDGKKYSYTDYCTLEDIGLKEYACENDRPVSTNFECPNGCNKGACISGINSNTTYSLTLSENTSLIIVSNGITHTIRLESIGTISGFDVAYISVDNTQQYFLEEDYNMINGLGIYLQNLFITNVGTIDATIIIRLSDQECNIFNDNCMYVPSCGDGKVNLNIGEQCDNIMPSYSCSNYGYNSGHLTCNSCQLDASGCYNYVETCGNNNLGNNEVCDGDKLGYTHRLNLSLSTINNISNQQTITLNNNVYTIKLLGGNSGAPVSAIINVNGYYGTLNIGGSKTFSNELNIYAANITFPNNTTVSADLEARTGEILSCTDLGYQNGTLNCNTNCAAYDDSQCVMYTNPINMTCNDTDGGLNYTIFGTVSGEVDGYIYTYSDYCIESSTLLTEYTCQNNQSTSIEYNCTYGCVDGVCATETNTGPTTFCNDTDGGLNYNIFGTIEGEFNGSGTQYASSDYCSNNVLLHENACINNTLPFEQMYNCTYGCSNGACLNNLPNNTYCNDSDGGYNYTIYGIVSGQISGSTYNYGDSCMNNQDIKEYVCQNNYPILINYVCPYGCAINSGVCMPNPNTGDVTPRIAYWSGKINQHTLNGTWTTDPDGSSGANINQLTYCKKWYPNTTSVIAYQLETITFRGVGNTGAYVSTRQSYACIVDPINMTCNDTDGGINYYTYGSVTAPFNGIMYTNYDTCTSSTKLTEYYCYNNIASTSNFTCSNCSNGKCMTTGNLTVTSTTGGTTTGSATNFVVPATKTIYASPNSDYVFTGWNRTSGNCTITNPVAATTTVQINSGTCIVKATFSPAIAYCNDTDGGVNYNVYGIISGQQNGMPYTINDVCLNSVQLTEQYCEGNYPSYQNYTCPNGCSNGACNLAPNVSVTCTATPITGTAPLNVTILATITGMAPYSFNLNFGDGNGMGSSATYNNPINVTHTYSAGTFNPSVTVTTTNNQTATSGCGIITVTNNTYCNDTDGGFNYYIFGTVSGQMYGSLYSYTDYCLYNASNNNTLSEYYCEYGMPNLVNYYCPNGCVYGECVNTYNQAQADYTPLLIAPSYATFGSTIPLNVTTINIGNGTANSYSYTKVKMVWQLPNSGSILHNVPPLAPGMSYNWIENTSCMNNSANISITIATDSYNDVNESNESNNIATKTIMCVS